MTYSEELDLQFKGARDYIQGPDIYNSALNILAKRHDSIVSIDFSFHKLSYTGLAICDSPPADTTALNAVCSFSSQGVKHKYYIVSSEKKIIRRVDYNEDDLVKRMSISASDKRIDLTFLSPFSDMETWVSMTKALHIVAMPECVGKWLFVRARFNEYISKSQTSTKTVKIAASLSHRLTRSEAFIDNQKAGEIYFSLI